MKSFFIYLILIFTLIFSPSLIIAQEKQISIKSSVSSELWFVNWKSETGLEELGIILDYDIKPSTAFGYSINGQIIRNGTTYSELLLDYISSKMEENINDEAFPNSDKNLKTYRKIKSVFNQRFSKNNSLGIILTYATFNGKLSIKNNGEYFGVPNGTNWDMDSEWFKGDLMWLLLNGDGSGVATLTIGFRYISYNKPAAIITFYGYERDNKIEVTSLISAEIENVNIKGKYFTFGMIDNASAMGNRVNRFSFSWVAYLGNTGIESSNNTFKPKFSAGIEGEVSINKVFRLKKRLYIIANLGYRSTYLKATPGEKIGVDENGTIYKGLSTYDKWSGPFIRVNIRL